MVVRSVLDHGDDVRKGLFVDKLVAPLQVFLGEMAFSELVAQVVLGNREITIHLRAEAVPAGQPQALSIPWTPPSAMRRREVIAVAGLGEGRAAAPMKAENRQKLIRAFAQARVQSRKGGRERAQSR